jgi:hypothetical protein
MRVSMRAWCRVDMKASRRIFDGGMEEGFDEV